jgi:glyoxylase-like metal-dependent hydrolase (beta-lactamase superfamily II)
MAANPPIQVAEGVHRLGTSLVNWYVVEDGGRLTVLDCGLPSYWGQVEPGLAALGRSMSDIDAIVLTHGDGDHVGFGERLRTTASAPVLIHRDDELLATTTKHKKTEKPIVGYLGKPAAWGLLTHFIRGGGLRPPPIGEVTTYEADQVLDVPGSPRVIPTPGHTDGHCALHFPQSDAVFVGDALCTRNPLTGRMGAQLMPRGLNVSTDTALRSLDAIEATGAQNVLPGHGDPWAGGAAQAAEAARSAGPS